MAELVLDILKCSNSIFNRAIIESGVLNTLTNKFFEYNWNSSLHFIYTEIVDTALKGNNDLGQTLLSAAGLPEKLIAAVNDSTIS